MPTAARPELPRLGVLLDADGVLLTDRTGSRRIVYASRMSAWRLR